MAVAGQTAPDGGLVWRVLGAWADLRAAMRAELDRDPTEGRLLFYAVLSGVVWFLGRAALLAWGPQGPALTGEAFRALIGWEFLSAVFYRTIMLYVIAGVAGLVARKLGGAGSWRDTRAAVFWGALVAAPAILTATLFALLLSGTPGQPAAIASTIGAVASAWVLSVCLAEAHGVRSPWRVLGVIVALVAALILALYLIRQGM